MKRRSWSRLGDGPPRSVIPTGLGSLGARMCLSAIVSTAQRLRQRGGGGGAWRAAILDATSTSAPHDSRHEKPHHPPPGSRAQGFGVPVGALPSSDTGALRHPWGPAVVACSYRPL